MTENTNILCTELSTDQGKYRITDLVEGKGNICQKVADDRCEQVSDKGVKLNIQETGIDIRIPLQAINNPATKDNLKACFSIWLIDYSLLSIICQFLTPLSNLIPIS